MNNHTGWQASLELDGKLCTTIGQANWAAWLLGWATEKEIAAEHGLWVVTVSDSTLTELLAHGFIEATVEKEGYRARGEIETP